jgi:ABC-type multidrug transport system fused ATPase/permease subunit
MSSARPEWAWLWKESKPFARYQLGGLLCITGASAVGLVQPLLMKWLIDDVLLPNGWWWGTLAIVTGLFLLAGIGRSALSSLGTLVNMLGVRRMTFHMHMRLVRHVQSLSADFHARHPVGDQLQRLERDVTVVGEFASEALPSLAQIVVGTSMAVAAMFYLDWHLSSVILPLLPVFAYARHRYRTVLRQCAEDVRSASGRQSSLLQEMLTGAVQIQLLGAERRLAREYRRVSLKTVQQQIGQKKSELMYSTLSVSIIAVATAAIVGYGGVRVRDGSLSLGGLVAFYGYIGSIFSPMNVAVGLFSRVIRMHASVRRLIELEQTPDVVRDAPDATPLTAPPRVLACRQITFDYVPDKPILRRVHFAARAGERVTLVGESGSGKSSLIKLVARLHDPVGGAIELDGRDIRSISLESLRRAISFVPQDPVLFQGTLRANLRYARPGATLDELNHAAWIASLTEVIDRLPHGWDTELGAMGAGLSGGERQRVAIARAVLQERPIFVLDEAFSALDGAAERRLLSRLENWAAGRILILVSHRLATAQWGDRVVVLRRGQIVEDASHEALDREGTHYRTLWRDRDTEKRVAIAPQA